MIEYPAMIYKNSRNRGYVANCIAKNLFGFGKTEEDALNNLKESLKSSTENIIEKSQISIKPIYGLFLA